MRARLSRADTTEYSVEGIREERGKLCTRLYPPSVIRLSDAYFRGKAVARRVELGLDPAWKVEIPLTVTRGAQRIELICSGWSPCLFTAAALAKLDLEDFWIKRVGRA